MRGILPLLAAALLVGEPAAAQQVTAVPDAAPANAVAVGAAYQLRWGPATSNGARLVAAFDHALSPDRSLTLGGRLGYLTGVPGGVVVGARAALWIDLPETELRAWGGLGADGWIATEAAPATPVALYTGLDLGLRVPLGAAFFLDLPVQLGVLPLEVPIVYAFSAGVRLGRRF